MSDSQPDIKLIRMLLERLERTPADSPWAHRASGVRGALMKMLEQMELGDAIDPVTLREDMSIGFQILKEAARARS
ncbi:MAG TPA: hypothetical protein VFO91_01185 [Anaerolineales bacterium]|nr:hypothetical protein [Anaerolineales bacterium]